MYMYVYMNTHIGQGRPPWHVMSTPACERSNIGTFSRGAHLSTRSIRNTPLISGEDLSSLPSWFFGPPEKTLRGGLGHFLTTHQQKTKNMNYKHLADLKRNSQRIIRILITETQYFDFDHLQRTPGKLGTKNLC